MKEWLDKVRPNLESFNTITDFAKNIGWWVLLIGAVLSAAAKAIGASWPMAIIIFIGGGLLTFATAFLVVSGRQRKLPANKTQDIRPKLVYEGIEGLGDNLFVDGKPYSNVQVLEIRNTQVDAPTQTHVKASITFRHPTQQPFEITAPWAKLFDTSFKPTKDVFLPMNEQGKLVLLVRETEYEFRDGEIVQERQYDRAFNGEQTIPLSPGHWTAEVNITGTGCDPIKGEAHVWIDSDYKLKYDLSQRVFRPIPDADETKTNQPEKSKTIWVIAGVGALVLALGLYSVSLEHTQLAPPTSGGPPNRDTDLPTPATVPLSVSQPSLGSTRFSSSTSIQPSVIPRLEIIFKNSPLFTSERKQRIESTLNAFHAYLGKLGFKPPTTVPPIEAVPGGTALGRQGGSGSIYRAELLIGETNLDDMTGITLMWADHAFMAMIKPIGISNEFAFRDHTAWIFAAYYTLSFDGKFDQKYGRDAWPTALWEIRTQYGQDFADRAMFYTFKTLNEPGPPPKDFNVFLERALQSGIDVIDNRSQALPGILIILRKHGVIR